MMVATRPERGLLITGVLLLCGLLHCLPGSTDAGPLLVASLLARLAVAPRVDDRLAGGRHVIGDGQQVEVLRADLLLVERLVAGSTRSSPFQ